MSFAFVRAPGDLSSFIHSPHRTFNDLSYHKRIKLHKNWREGRYEEHIFFHQHALNPTQLHLERDQLYLTRSGQLRVHRRQRKGILKRKPDRIIGRERDSDITHFVKKSETIFAGRRNGSVFICNADAGEILLEEPMDAQSPKSVEFLDFNGDLFVTATRSITKLWRLKSELNMPFLDPLRQFEAANKCLRLSPDGTQCAAGRYNERSRTALRLLEVET